MLRRWINRLNDRVDADLAARIANVLDARARADRARLLQRDAMRRAVPPTVARVRHRDSTPEDRAAVARAVVAEADDVDVLAVQAAVWHRRLMYALKSPNVTPETVNTIVDRCHEAMTAHAAALGLTEATIDFRAKVLATADLWLIDALPEMFGQGMWV